VISCLTFFPQTLCCLFQVLALEDIFKHRVKNVVFMGMGEPMLNMKSVLEAHQCLNKVSSDYDTHPFLFIRQLLISVDMFLLH